MNTQLFKGNRITIGLILDNLRRNSSGLFWESLIDYCKVLDINLVILPGESIGSKKPYGYQHNVMYDFISENQLDGLIFMTNSIGDYVESSTLSQVYQHYLKLPFVSINIDLEGAISTIYCDNAKGIRNVINHLVVYHGYKRIGFVKGQETHKDAIERFEAYKQCLIDHHIQYDENMVVEGDFYVESGEQAIEILFDQRKVSLDVIVAANDDMAIGMMTALTKRGIRVPRDVKIVGFDDIREIRFNKSPLASVRQPLKEMAEAAITALLNYMNHKQVSRHHYLTPIFIPRASCGCISGNMTFLEDEKGYEEYPNSYSIQRVITEYVGRSPYRKIKFKNQYVALINTLVEECESEKCINEMISTYNQILFEQEITTEFVRFIQLLLDFTRGQVLTRTDNMESVRWAEMFFRQAASLLMELKLSVGGLTRIMNNRKAHHLMVDSIDEITSAESIDGLMDILEKELREVGIQTCFIHQYQNESDMETMIKARKLPKKSKMLLGYNDQVRFDCEGEFLTKEMIPEECKMTDRPYNLVFEPIYYKAEVYGYMIYEIGMSDGAIYETIRRHIGTAIHYLKLLESR